MQTYKITATGATFPENEISAHFPNVGFVFPLGQDVLEHFGLELVAPTAEEIAAQEVADALAMQAAILQGMTDLFDTTAQSKHYDNRITCALRAGYQGPFHDEGVAFATWMDNCNAQGYAMLAQVQAGMMAMPATVADALALLPELQWPAV